MRRSLLAVVATLPLALAACGGKGRPTAATSQPSTGLSAERKAADSSGSSGGARVRMLDQCDPGTFNLSPPNGVGPGTCVVGNQEEFTTFGAFIAELQATKVADAWEFDEDKADVAAGQTLRVRNEGGEVHTFTRVQKFGGGIVPPLNDLSGNPVPAPECNPRTLVFRPPGSDLAITTGPGGALPAGTYKFQCCIHPWMRAIVTVGADGKEHRH